MRNEVEIGRSPAIPENEIAADVVHAAMAAHRQGLFRPWAFRVEELLEQELKKRNRTVDHRVEPPLEYDLIKPSGGGSAYLVVDGLVILQVCGLDGVTPTQRNRLASYVRLTRRRLGMLVDFVDDTVRITRCANGLPE